jgi:hypothetical protein
VRPIRELLQSSPSGFARVRLTGAGAELDEVLVLAFPSAWVLAWVLVSLSAKVLVSPLELGLEPPRGVHDRRKHLVGIGC